MCPERDVLVQILSGALPAERAAEQGHVATCAACQTALDELSDDAEVRGWATAAKPWRDEPRLGRLIAALCVSPEPPPERAGLTPLSPPRCPGDLGSLGSLRVQAELGRGGMGVVYRGYDESLQRAVAIKVLRPELTGDGLAARLLFEAQAAARFRHDHAINIHAVAMTPAGVPYIVMEYVAGQTLAQRLRAEPPLAFRTVAELLAQVAEALAAAHAAGLVHRDVKPSNILLEARPGTELRAKIVDFGLARLVERPSGLTQTGLLVGTPAYMSPEQVEGRANLDARSDVYNLGATLYHALTGQVPFQGTATAVLRQVLEDEPRPPRRLNDQVPRALETICLKAMAKQPQGRYPSATAFADDLRRFLRGEPIQAKPAGRVERGWRWCRRRPLAAALLVALVLVGLSGIAGIVWQWQRAEANAAEARRDFERARAAVDLYLTEVSEDPELKAANLEPLRRRLLLAARAYYETFVREHPGEAALQAELGKAYGRLGSIAAILDGPPASIALFEQQRAVYMQLLSDQPGTPAYRHELAESCWHLGYGQHYAGRRELAWEAFRAARQLWEGLVRDYPAEPKYAARLIRTLNSLGRSYDIGRRPQEAEQTLRDGQAAYEQARHAGHAAEPHCQESAAWVLANLGSFYRTAGRPGNGQQPLEQAVDLAEQLVQADARAVGKRTLLRHGLEELGQVYVELGQANRAEAIFVREHALAEELARDHPADAEQSAAVAQASLSLGQVRYWLQRRPAAALRDFDDANAIFERLIAQYPDVQPYWSFYIAGARQAAELLWETGQPQEAWQRSSAALKLVEKLGTAKGTSANVDKALFSFALDRADALLRLHRFAEARQDCDLAQRHANSDAERRSAEQMRQLVDGHLLMEQGEVAGAAAAAQAIAAASAEAPPLYLAAVLLARASATDPAHGARALAVLRQAQQHGYFRWPSRRALLETDPDLAPLRQRDHFRSYVQELRQLPPMATAATP